MFCYNFRSREHIMLFINLTAYKAAGELATIQGVFAFQWRFLHGPFLCRLSAKGPHHAPASLMEAHRALRVPSATWDCHIHWVSFVYKGSFQIFHSAEQGEHGNRILPHSCPHLGHVDFLSSELLLIIFPSGKFSSGKPLVCATGERTWHLSEGGWLPGAQSGCKPPGSWVVSSTEHK